MARAGETIECPQLRERVVFKLTGEETGGRLLRFEFFLDPGAEQPTSHRHMGQESRFEVIAGRLGARLGSGRPRVYLPGETLIVPAGTEHVIWNAEQGETEALVEIEPAGDFERFLQTTFGLMRDGRLRGHRPIPRPFLHSALLASANDICISGVPIVLQRPAIRIAARLAKLRGYRLAYPEYSGDRVVGNPTA